LVELPRDHGKSVQACVRVLWELGRDPGLRVVLACASDTHSVKLSDCRGGKFPNLPWAHRQVRKLAATTIGHPYRAHVSEALAAQRCRFLRDAVTANERLRLVFPQLRPARQWRANAFTIRRPA